MEQLTGMSMANLLWLLSVAVLLIFAIAYRARLYWWWMNFWYRIPFVGKLARLSRDTSVSSNPEWLNSETTLCADFRKFVHYMAQDDFRKRLTYLKKAQDNGRSPLPAWLLFVLILLVAAEGLGFAYLLGTWMAREGSANVHTLLMFAIVTVLCIILVFVTHAAGHQLYRTNLIRHCRKSWNEDGKPGSFHYQDIGLEDDQASDDNKPSYTQTVHRVGTSGSYVMVYLAAITIAAIAVTTTWVRLESLKKQEIESVVGAQVAGTNAAAGNPFAAVDSSPTPLPPEVVASQQEADQKADVDHNAAEHSEGLAAFITLAIIFVVTQIVGIYAGFKWGFAGKDSKEAYKTTRGFATYSDFVAFYDPILHEVQSLLSDLRQRLEDHITVKRGSASKTFLDYLSEKREEMDQHQARTAAQNIAPRHVPDPTPSVAAESPAENVPESSVTELLATFDALGSKEEKLDFLLKLNEPENSEIKKILAERKRKQHEAEELMDLID